MRSGGNIARELHDSAGQTLAALGMNLREALPETPKLIPLRRKYPQMPKACLRTWSW